MSIIIIITCAYTRVHVYTYVSNLADHVVLLPHEFNHIIIYEFRDNYTVLYSFGIRSVQHSDFA